MPIRRIVIDVLVPYEPDILTFAESLSGLQGISGVNIQVLEHDEKTRTVEMTIEGEDLAFQEIRGIIDDLGGSIHSVDEVAAGSKIVESRAQNGEGT